MGEGIDRRKVILSRFQQGWQFMEIYKDLQKMYEIAPEVYCSRTGKAIGKATLSRVLSKFRDSNLVAD